MIKVTKAQLKDLGDTMFGLGLMEKVYNDAIEDDGGENEDEVLFYTSEGDLSAAELGQSILDDAACILGVEFEVVE